MALVIGLAAFAQLGPVSSSGADAARHADVRRTSSASAGVGRARGSVVDAARASLPLPRVAAVDTPVPRTVAPPRASRSRASRGHGDVWAELARCESGGNPAARSANGRYTGAFQFSNETWHGLGYRGRAADHPYEVQLVAAQRLQARSGWGQWPRCARRLGLR